MFLQACARRGCRNERNCRYWTRNNGLRTRSYAIEEGHQVTVWNPTDAKTQPLVALGAESAVSVAGAVQASPLFIICVEDYSVATSLLEVKEGRSLILWPNVDSAQHCHAARGARE